MIKAMFRGLSAALVITLTCALFWFLERSQFWAFLTGTNLGALITMSCINIAEYRAERRYRGIQ